MTTGANILIAGLGNIFLGDDAFGVEVVRQLHPTEFPYHVRVMDFGTRAYDLAYALTENYEAVVLVDATSRGGAPGTLYLIQPDLAALHESGPPSADAHSLSPAGVVQMAQAFGQITAKLFLVGCEPARLENDSGDFGLSEAVRAAVPGAIKLIRKLVLTLQLDTNAKAGLTPA